MPFIHPAIFWGGLAAVSVPILIHILNRRRFRLRDWAAMRFLLDSLRKNRRRLRIEELILLAIRCLVILLAAMAIGRFTGCSAMKMLPGGMSASHVVVYVLDDSYSMGQTYGAGTLLTAAASDLADQIKALPKGDQAAIVLTSQANSNERFFPLNFITDVNSLVTRLDKLQPSDRRTSLEDALGAAVRIFAGKTEPKRLFVLSDFRRVDLTGRDHTDAIRKRFAQLRKQGVVMVAMDYGLKARMNLTLTGMSLRDRFVIAGRPARIAVGVRNNGSVRAENVRVRITAKLLSGGTHHDVELPGVRVASLDPGETRHVEFPITCTEAGSAVVSAHLPGDDLPGDNNAHLVLNVRSCLRVLVVDGHVDLGDPTQSESYFFTSAIDPRGDGSYGNKPEVVTPDALSGVNFDDYDLVVLMDVPDFPLQPSGRDNADLYPQLTALEKYVRQGGGLAIFTGDRINLDFYNKRMYAGGAGLLPFPIGPRVGDPDKQDKYFRLDPKSLATDPLLKEFRADSGVMTNLVRFFAFTPTRELAPTAASPYAKPPHVLARFTDAGNSAAIVTRQYGRGTVVTFLTTGSARWTDWPSDPARTYVAVMNDLLAELARSQSAMARRVGEPIIYELSNAQRDVHALLKTPQYPAVDVVDLAPQVEKGRLVIRFDRTDHAGVYVLTLRMPDGSSQEILTARNVDPVEGDLACGHREELAAALGSNDFRYDRRIGVSGSRVVRAGQDKEYWTWALVALLALLAVETVLGRRFGHYTKT